MSIGCEPKKERETMNYNSEICISDSWQFEALERRGGGRAALL